MTILPSYKASLAKGSLGNGLLIAFLTWKISCKMFDKSVLNVSPLPSLSVILQGLLQRLHIVLLLTREPCTTCRTHANISKSGAHSSSPNARPTHPPWTPTWKICWVALMQLTVTGLVTKNTSYS